MEESQSKQNRTAAFFWKSHSSHKIMITISRNDLLEMRDHTSSTALQIQVRQTQASHEVWVEMVNNGAERETIAPRRSQVGDFDTSVSIGDFLTPLQQVHGRSVTTHCWRCNRFVLQQIPDNSRSLMNNKTTRS